MPTKSHFELFFLFISCYLFATTTFYAQVGIGTTNPKTALDINGAISLREGGILGLANGINNDIALGANTFSSYRITGPTANYSISGIIPQANADGQIITLNNTTESSLILLHDTTASINNRIFCPGEKDLVLTGKYATATLQYNKTELKWFVINHSDNRYGDNMQSKVLPSGTQLIRTSIGTYRNITGASITFTPKHATVYLSFGISGYNPLSGTNGDEQLSWFAVRVLNNGTRQGDFVSISAAGDNVNGAVGAATVNAVNFPLTVIPNVPVTIRLQGTTGGIIFDSGFTIDRTAYSSYMTILD